MLFPQPEELFVEEPVEEVAGPCDRCGGATLHQYRVVDYRGWLRVTKCRACLHVATREPIVSPPLAQEQP
jgi:hypothetical protein